jgi:serine protease Do
MKRRVLFTIMFISLLLAGSVIGFGCGISQAAKPGEVSVSAGAPMIPASFSDLAEKVRPGVVNIQTVKKVESTGRRILPGNPFGYGGRNPFDDFFEQFERNQPERKQQGVGSGFVMSRDGYILTNNHVVEGADEIKVKLADGKELTGKVVGRDPKTDIAVVKIDGPADLHPLALGDSDKLKVGDWVIDGYRRNRQRERTGDRLGTL